MKDNIIEIQLVGTNTRREKKMWQYDYGQLLRITGQDFPKVTEVHFSTQQRGGQTLDRVGSTVDGVLSVQIPNELLRNGGTSSDYTIYAFVYLSDDESGNTKYMIQLPVASRPEPTDPSEDPSIDPSIFREAINAVNASADRAESAEKSAKESAEEAQRYAETARDSVGKVEEARNSAISAIGTAEESTLSNINERTEESVQRIQSQAEASENDIKQSIADASEKKSELDIAVGNAAAAKENLEKAVQSAGNAKSELDTSVGEAGEAKTALDGSIKFAGEKQTVLDATVSRADALDKSLKENIQTGTALQKELVASGEKAVEDIQTAGSEQLDKMQTIAEEFTADREQITKNKNDISSLNEELAKLYIVDESSGESIILDDAVAEKPLKDMKLYGWSRQETTTGKNLLTEHVGSSVNNTWCATSGVMLQAGTAYTFSAGCECAGLYAIKIGETVAVKTVYDTSVMTFTPEETGLYWFKAYKNEIFTTTGQLEVGTKATSYEPYTGGQPSPSPDYPQEIVSAGSSGEIGVEVRGKNLVNIPDSEFEGVKFCTGIHLKKGEYRLTADIESTSSDEAAALVLRKNEQEVLGTSILIKKNAEAVINLSDDIDEIILYAGVSFNASQGYTAIYKNIMVSASKSIAYEPYHTPQSLSISTPTGLPAIPVDSGGNYTDANGQQWIADYIDFKRGKYVQRVQRVSCVDLSWDTWGVDFKTKGITGFFAYTGKKLPAILRNEMTGNITFFGMMVWGGEEVGCYANFNYQYIVISVNNDSLEDVTSKQKAIASFRKMCERIDAYILYIIADPIERDLTASEIQAYKALTTYAGTTVIENDSDCYMDVGYIADAKKYIDKKFDELSAAIIASASEAE